MVDLLASGEALREGYKFKWAMDQATIARLEAQNGELVAALEEVTDALHDDEHGVEESVGIMRACTRGLCERARAAIGRARGGTA